MLDKPLLINGEWRAPAGNRSAEVHNPATGEVIAQLALCERADLDAALEAAQQGFETWRRTTAVERAKLGQIGRQGSEIDVSIACPWHGDAGDLASMAREAVRDEVALAVFSVIEW